MNLSSPRFESTHIPKKQNGRHKLRSGRHTLQPAKKYTKRKESGSTYSPFLVAMAYKLASRSPTSCQRHSHILKSPILIYRVVVPTYITKHLHSILCGIKKMCIVFSSFLLHSFWLIYHNSNQRKIGSLVHPSQTHAGNRVSWKFFSFCNSEIQKGKNSYTNQRQYCINTRRKKENNKGFVSRSYF